MSKEEMLELKEDLLLLKEQLNDAKLSLDYLENSILDLLSNYTDHDDAMVEK